MFQVSDLFQDFITILPAWSSCEKSKIIINKFQQLHEKKRSNHNTLKPRDLINYRETLNCGYLTSLHISLVLSALIFSTFICAHAFTYMSNDLHILGMRIDKAWQAFKLGGQTKSYTYRGHMHVSLLDCKACLQRKMSSSWHKKIITSNCILLVHLSLLCLLHIMHGDCHHVGLMLGACFIAMIDEELSLPLIFSLLCKKGSDFQRTLTMNSLTRTIVYI